MVAQIALDVCTPEGKTWLAKVNGISSKKYGLNRSFIDAVDRDTSRSGKTGVYLYAVRAGIYESNEGRRRYGRRYWRVTDDGTVTEITLDDVLAAFT